MSRSEEERTNHTTGINFLFALTFSLYSLTAGLALNRIPQHLQNNSKVIK
jgi:hypothetical protein